VDLGGVRRKYRRNARIYDRLVRRPTARLRARAIGQLGLTTGASVVDLGCGTGLSLAALRDAVGTQGRVVGIDASPDMLMRAREKIREGGWDNVTLVEADAAAVALEPGAFDGVLCFYTHDIMRSRQALGRAVAALRPGGRVVAAGAKLAAGAWGRLANSVTVAYSRTAITNLTGFDRPWTVLEEIVGELAIESHLWDTAYLARGVKRGG
jgi:ubiquinone/menaquinone biosynthesis C-methylase UbiE